MAILKQSVDETCYPDGAWIDYAGGMVDGERAQEMRRHAVSGCSDCSVKAAIWAGVVKASTADPQYEPPLGVVNTVKNAFTVDQRLGFFNSVAVVARMVLDSFREPLPAGIRGAIDSEPRHLVHEAGDIIVDIQIDTEAGRGMSLTGQLAYRDGVAGDVAGTQVYLTRGAESVVASAIANEFGEFTIDTEPLTSGLDLLCVMPSGDLVSVSFPRDER